MTLAHIALVHTRYLYGLTMRAYRMFRRLAAKCTINIATFRARDFPPLNPEAVLAAPGPSRFDRPESSHVYVIHDIILFYFAFTFYSSNTTKIYRARLLPAQKLSSRTSAIILSVLARRALIPPGGRTKNCASKVRTWPRFHARERVEITGERLSAIRTVP